MRGLPVGAVHPNRPRECDHVVKQAIEVNRPYLRGGVADLVA
jgi:ribosomal protein L34E